MTATSTEHMYFVRADTTGAITLTAAVEPARPAPPARVFVEGMDPHVFGQTLREMVRRGLTINIEDHRLYAQKTVIGPPIMEWDPRAVYILTLLEMGSNTAALTGVRNNIRAWSSGAILRGLTAGFIASNQQGLENLLLLLITFKEFGASYEELLGPTGLIRMIMDHYAVKKTDVKRFANKEKKLLTNPDRGSKRLVLLDAKFIPILDDIMACAE